MLALLLAAALPIQAPAPLQESITVERVLVDVRVTDDYGEPVLGLTPADFAIRIAGKHATVESVEWVQDGVAATTEALVNTAVDDAAAPAVAPRGRTIVLFVQTDFGRHQTRTHGHLNFLRHADEMLAAFGPDDRFAVFSFDSHLKFRLDLTSDRRLVLEALKRTISIDHPPPPPAVPEPSLAKRLDRQAMRRAAHSENAMLLLAYALQGIPGPKAMLLLGWGLGDRDPFGVRMKHGWEAARRALDAARVSIFALDTSHADYHDLEIGLQTAADETGGFYAKTHLFAGIAIKRLTRTLSGHYEVTVRTSEPLPAGTHALRVQVRGQRDRYVLAPMFVDVR